MAVTTPQITSTILGLVGAVVGGVLGYYTFQWVFDHGFYGMMIPGAFVGLGCGLLAQHPSQVRGAICGLAAVGLGLYTEWTLRPFVADKSLAFFLKNIPVLTPVTLVMIAAGAFLAYWLGKDSGFHVFPGKQRSAALSEQQHSPPSS